MSQNLKMSLGLTSIAALLISATLAGAGEGAGGREGHGGVSIVCRAQGKIKSVELLDIFEANNQYGLKVADRPTPVDDQLDSAMNRLASRPDLLEEAQTELARVQAQIKFLKEGVGLNPTDDAFPLINKKGCKYEQLAIYTLDGQVLVDADLWSHLSDTGKAALYLHETVYKMARDRGETSSVNSRKLVGYLFTRPNQPEVVKQLLAAMFVPPAPPAPPAPPTPTWPAAFNDISAGIYRTNAQFCSVRIYKDTRRGTMTLEWINDDARCDAAGQIVNLSCDYSSCEGPKGDTARFNCDGQPHGYFKEVVKLEPNGSGRFIYMIGAYTSPNYFCRNTKALYQ